MYLCMCTLRDDLVMTFEHPNQSIFSVIYICFFCSYLPFFLCWFDFTGFGLGRECFRFLGCISGLDLSVDDESILQKVEDGYGVKSKMFNSFLAIVSRTIYAGGCLRI